MKIVTMPGSFDQKIKNCQAKEGKRSWEATQTDPPSISSLNGIRHIHFCTHHSLHYKQYEGWDHVLVSPVLPMPSTVTIF